MEFARLVIRNAESALAVKDVLRHTTLIGSLPGCNIQLIAPDVAPVHCALTLEADGLYVRDLRSMVGTRVNGVPVEIAGLSDGDELQIGSFHCRLETNLRGVSDAEDARVTARGASTSETGTASGAQTDSTKVVATLFIRNRDGAVVKKDLTRRTTLVGSMQGATSCTLPDHA